MPISVQYGPSAESLGQASYGAGQRMGQYQSVQDQVRLMQALQQMKMQRAQNAQNEVALGFRMQNERRNQRNQRFSDIGQLGTLAASLGVAIATQNPLALAGAVGAGQASNEKAQDDRHFDILNQNQVQHQDEIYAKAKQFELLRNTFPMFNSPGGYGY